MKTLSKLALLSLFAVTTLLAQQPTAPVKPQAEPKTPAITDAQKSKFFKAQLQAQQTAQVAQEKQAAFQATIKELQDTCGKEATLQLDASGDPTCIVMSPPADAPKK